MGWIAPAAARRFLHCDLRGDHGRNTFSEWIQLRASEPAPVWDFEPWNALRLIKLPFCWSSVSLGRIPPTGQRILLHQKALGQNDPPPPYAFNANGIFARIGSTPWEWSDEFEIFNPDRDRGLGNRLDERPVEKLPMARFCSNLLPSGTHSISR